MKPDNRGEANTAQQLGKEILKEMNRKIRFCAKGTPFNKSHQIAFGAMITTSITLRH
jgi:hypothetical protein